MFVVQLMFVLRKKVDRKESKKKALIARPAQPLNQSVLTLN